MRGAAESAASGGVVAELFEGLSVAPGSVPSLRLMAALHASVLEGSAGELAEYYPTPGRAQPPTGAWHAASRLLHERSADMRGAVARTVQTNEPGRSVALFGVLLWLGERFGQPVRLLEIGASAGLCLIPDHYAYVVSGARLGDPQAELVFAEPWVGTPVANPPAAAEALRVVERAGCDLEPLDLRSEDDHRTALSYIWPDELDRMERFRLAADAFVADPVPIDRASADEWLSGRLRIPVEGTLTVIWQSVVRQYLGEDVKSAVAETIETAGLKATEDAPVAWATMEPTKDHLGEFDVRCTLWPRGKTASLGPAGNHGPPVRWR